MSLDGLTLDSTLEDLLTRMENQIPGFGWNTQSGTLQLVGEVWGAGNSLEITGAALDSALGAPVSLQGTGELMASGSFLAVARPRAFPWDRSPRSPAAAAER